jgi:threonine dehydratase
LGHAIHRCRDKYAAFGTVAGVSTADLPIDIGDVRAAAGRIEGLAHRTPLLRSRTLDSLAGAPVALKAENLQRAGAFKFRGACNAVAALAPDHVCAVSSGNHAQALALAARLHGARATILMPADAPASKRAATEGYGAEVVAFDRYADDREALVRALAAERGLTLVHPYDEPLVMAGAGTVGLELAADLDDLDLVLVPCGGGGLLSGVATAVKALRPDARVVGVEPEAGDDVARSLRAGERVSVPVPQTIADGQQLTTPGERPWQVIRALVDDVVTVSDAEIVDAMRLLFERLKVVAEPSGASALAALLAGRVAPRGGGTVAVVLSGGNVDAARFAALTGA